MWWSEPRARAARRACLHVAGVAVLAAALGGCGFQLRQSTNLEFDTIALRGQGGPLMDLLRRRILTTTATRIVDDPKQAQAVFTLMSDATAQTPTAYNSDGTVAQYALTETARFELTAPDGHPYIASTTITRTSMMSYNTSTVLAKANEADLLYAGMRRDLVDRILFQVGALHAPLPAPAASR